VNYEHGALGEIILTGGKRKTLSGFTLSTINPTRISLGWKTGLQKQVNSVHNKETSTKRSNHICN
jgi:hypothetical protein